METSGVTIDFGRGVPPLEALPTHEIAMAMYEATKNDVGVLQYGHRSGYAPLRKMLAASNNANEHQVLIGNGSLHLLEMIAALLSRQNSGVVMVEQPTYDRVIRICKSYAKVVVGIPLESDGVSIARLEREIRRHVPAFFYTNPTFQNPSGTTTAPYKRHRVLELALEHKFRVVVDTAYDMLRYAGDSVPRFREIDPAFMGQLITVGSFSKLVGPGLRVGYLIADEGIVAPLTDMAEATYLTPVLPTQAAVAKYLEKGLLEPHLARLKDMYAVRCQAMGQAVREYLPEAKSVQPEGGFFQGVWLPVETHVKDLVSRAHSVGLFLTPGRSFFPSPVPEDDWFVRLPFAALMPAQIREGVRRLAELVA